MEGTHTWLIEKIRDRKVLLFCGPEISASSDGLPSPRILAQELSEKLAKERPEKLAPPESIESTSLSRVAQLYEEDSAGKETDPKYRDELVRFMAARLDDPTFAPSEMHELIAALPFYSIATTNWDNLLEVALSQQHKPFVKVVREPDITRVQEDKVILIKLYGSIEQPESLVISLNDIRKAPVRIPEIMKFLDYNSAIRTLLFLGFDLGDYEFKQFYDDIVGHTGLQRHQALAVRPEPAAEDASYWERRSVTMIDTSSMAFLRDVAKTLGVSAKGDSSTHSSGAQQAIESFEGVAAGSNADYGNAFEEFPGDGMPMSVADLERQLQVHRQTLARLKARRSSYPEGGSSLSIENRIQQTRSIIRRLESMLKMPS
jgi:hypothetical protein